MKEKNYDFSGWATKYGTKCSDGRTILKGAFADNDGQQIPLVWNHDHAGIESVIGHAILEHKDQGVYAYGYFNNTDTAKTARILVESGDITSLSIYANKLTQNSNKEVSHGQIRELSLVLSGANPGAKIDNVLAHSESAGEDGIICWEFENDISVVAHSDETDTEKGAEDMKSEKTQIENSSEEIEHADENETVKDVFETFTEKQQTALYAIIGQLMEDDSNAPVEDKVDNVVKTGSNSDDSDETVADVFNSLNEKQKAKENHYGHEQNVERPSENAEQNDEGTERS